MVFARALPASSNSPSAILVQQGMFGMRAAMSADAQARELMQWFLSWCYLARAVLENLAKQGPVKSEGPVKF